MRERLETMRKRLGFAELVIAYIVVIAFLIGGVVGGTPVTILAVCAGLVQTECTPDRYIALNPAAGLLAAAGAVVALIVTDGVMRRRQQ